MFNTIADTARQLLTFTLPAALCVSAQKGTAQAVGFCGQVADDQWMMLAVLGERAIFFAAIGAAYAKLTKRHIGRMTLAGTVFGGLVGFPAIHEYMVDGNLAKAICEPSTPRASAKLLTPTP